MNLNDVAAEALSKEIQVKIDKEIMKTILDISGNLLGGSNVPNPRIQKEQDRFDEVKRLEKELEEANISASKLVKQFEPMAEALYETAQVLNDLLVDHNPAFSENDDELNEARIRIYKNGIAKYIQNIIKENSEVLKKWGENTIVKAEQEKIAMLNGTVYAPYIPLTIPSIIGIQSMSTPSSTVYNKKDEEDCLESAKQMWDSTSKNTPLSGLTSKENISQSIHG